jgi:hypothetical protein
MRLPGVPPGETALVGWRAIAEYLDVPRATAERWSSMHKRPKWATYPLPIRETAGHPWILAREADIWLSQQTVPKMVADEVGRNYAK